MGVIKGDTRSLEYSSCRVYRERKLCGIFSCIAPRLGFRVQVEGPLSR